MIAIYLDVPFELIPANDGASITGIAYAAPVLMTTLTWQTEFDTEPASVTVNLEGSLDNENWAVIDNSANVEGEIKTLQTNVTFLRAVVTNGDEVFVTVTVVCKN